MKSGVLAIDAGTTGVRSVLYDIDGNPVVSSYRKIRSFYPENGWVEQDAREWWEAVVTTASEAILMAGDIRVKSIAITNQRETIVPVDGDGNPLHRAIVWQDRRSWYEAKDVASILGTERLYRITGLTPDPYFSLPKILWLKKNMPEIYRKTHKFLLVHDYIVHHLTGVFATDISNASRTMMFDIRHRIWSDEILSATGISADLLPKLYRPGDLISKIKPSVAEEIGLDRDVIVVAGGGDQQCSALGLGVVHEGKIKATTGTGTFIVAPTTGMPEKPSGLLYSVHVYPGMNIVEASIFTTGALLDWVKRTMFSDSDYETINSEARLSRPGEVLFLPFLSGAGAPHWRPDMRGAIASISLATTRGDIARAAMEAVAFEVRSNIEAMEKEGMEIEEVLLDGGGAKSDLWNSIIASATGKKCRIPQDTETTARGAAILALTPVVGSIDNAMQRFHVQFRDVEPDDEMKAIYDRVYSSYKKLRKLFMEQGG